MVEVAEADLISGFFESILFGIFFVLSTTSLVLLLRRQSYPKDARRSLAESRSASTLWTRWSGTLRILRQSPLIVANVLLMITLTVHCVISLRRLILAIVHHDTKAEAEAFISDLGELTQVIRLVLLFVDMFIGDLVITYRVWHVWGGNKRIIVLPMLTTTALLATGIGLIYEFVVANPSGSVFDASISPWITVYCIMTFCTNIYGTIVIAYRIWSSNRVLKRSNLGDDGYHSLLEGLSIFVESAALYTAWGIFFAIVYGTKSHLQIIGTGCTPPVLGVTFMLITVRVGLGYELRPTRPLTTTSGGGTIQWAAPPPDSQNATSYVSEDRAPSPVPLGGMHFNPTDSKGIDVISDAGVSGTHIGEEYRMAKRGLDTV